MPTRIRVTELDDWQTCRLAWWYKWRAGLRPVKEAASSPAMSGRAVHFGIEAGLLKRTGPDGAVQAATMFLESKGEGSARFAVGVETAIRGVPDYIWKLPLPQSEDEVEALSIDGDVVFVGRPDVWWVDEDGLTVVDFKSTSSDEMNKQARYQMWNLQPRYYAVMLKEAGRVPQDLPVYIHQMVLSTRGKHAIGVPWLVPERLLDQAWGRMHDASRVIRHATTVTIAQAHLGAHCEWCDYAPIDEAILTGGDAEWVEKQQYTKRRVA